MISILDFLVEAGLAALPWCRPPCADSMTKKEEALKTISGAAHGTARDAILVRLNGDSKNQRLYFISSVTSRADSVHNW
ncbi:hypothetical protein B0T37_10640 [Chromobacterium violaceum]|uniref:hypothetical protein n=1 Tax=Chromobacterium violaceum TaxID=536 RepID=UPI0009DB5536|nr:hypothetical protein [Chromobacterium violaceum]OQS26511.1 hypothetical protein B0T37_10640 [Chromobacterium violaceum]